MNLEVIRKLCGFKAPLLSMPGIFSYSAISSVKKRTKHSFNTDNTVVAFCYKYMLFFLSRSNNIFINVKGI